MYKKKENTNKLEKYPTNTTDTTEYSGHGSYVFSMNLYRRDIAGKVLPSNTTLIIIKHPHNIIIIITITLYME